MIEQIMIFALGFLVAGMLALLLLPLFWSRAVRLSRRRLEMQMPLSMTEVVAERDQLRAEFGVEQRRLEQALERATQKQAEALTEAGRNAAIALARSQELAESRRLSADVEKALAAASSRANEAEPLAEALTKKLQEAEAQLQSQTEVAAALETKHRRLENLADERRATIASLETRVSGLDMRLADALQEIASTKARANGRSAGDGPSETGAPQPNEAPAGFHAHWAIAPSPIAPSEAETFRPELAAAEERAKALQRDLAEQGKALRLQEKDFAGELQLARSQISALKKDLDDTRRQNAEPRREAGARAGRGRSPREPQARKGQDVTVAERGEGRDESLARQKDPVLDRPA